MFFLELSCFFDDPENVDSLISGSSAFSKTSWNIWKFTVHILLKSALENFEHYFTSVWDECNCAVVWAFLELSFFGIGMKTDLSVYWCTVCLVFFHKFNKVTDFFPFCSRLPTQWIIKKLTMGFDIFWLWQDESEMLIQRK